MRRLLLFVTYYLLVTPIGLLTRVVRDPLSRRRNPRSPSYWVYVVPPHHPLHRDRPPGG